MSEHIHISEEILQKASELFGRSESCRSKTKEYLDLIEAGFSKFDQNASDPTYEEHHIIPKSICPEYRLRKDNLIKVPHSYHIAKLHMVLPGCFEDDSEEYSKMIIPVHIYFSKITEKLRVKYPGLTDLEIEQKLKELTSEEIDKYYEDAIRNLSEKNSGEGNPQYGKKWFHMDDTNYYFNPEDHDVESIDGLVPGRILSGQSGNISDLIREKEKEKTMITEITTPTNLTIKVANQEDLLAILSFYEGVTSKSSCPAIRTGQKIRAMEAIYEKAKEFAMTENPNLKEFMDIELFKNIPMKPNSSDSVKSILEKYTWSENLAEAVVYAAKNISNWDENITDEEIVRKFVEKYQQGNDLK